MRLGRLAILRLELTPGRLSHWGLEIGPAEVKARPVTHDGEDTPNEILLTAEIELATLPALDSAGHIAIPGPEREACEQALEIVADLYAVAQRAERSLSSTIPSVGFVPQTDEEFSWLEESSGILLPPAPASHEVLYAPYVEPGQLAELADRIDGVQLLSEVHSQANMLGQYRSLVRFFEAAFGAPFVQIPKKLGQLLGAGHLGYDRAETTEWAALRHGATHGDGRKTVELTFEVDVRPYVSKMVEAAYDVLLNKEAWGDSSRARRDIWTPMAFIKSDGSPVLTQGMEARLSMRLTDEFRRFPLHLRGCLSSLPEGWWHRAASR